LQGNKSSVIDVGNLDILLLGTKQAEKYKIGKKGKKGGGGEGLNSYHQEYTNDSIW